MTGETVPGAAFTDCWNHIGVRGDRSCEKLETHTHCRNCDAHESAAQAIVQRPLPPEYSREWTDYFSREESVQAKADRVALVFRIGREWLALPAKHALTVAPMSAVHRLPHRQSHVLLGIVNIKGRLYPCMSLAGLIATDTGEFVLPEGRRAFPRMLLVQLGQQAFALPVQDLYGMHRYAAQEMEAPAATNAAPANSYVSGVLSVAAMRIGFLDDELLANKLAEALG